MEQKSVISIEEYLDKRRKLREKEKKRSSGKIISYKEKSSALKLAELYI